MACQPGYFGKFCNQTCPPGFFGLKCGGKCVTECFNCHPVNGCLSDFEIITKSRTSVLEDKNMSTVSQNSIQGTSVSLKYSIFGVGTAIVIALLLIIINVCRESTSEQKEKDQELKKNDNKATDVTVYYAKCKNNTL